MNVMTDKDRSRNARPMPVVMVACAAGLVCLLVYLRTLGNDFIYTDDPVYVYNNEQIRSLDWELLAAAFTGLFAGDYWMPLTWISFAVDYRFWGLNPAGYHLTNIVLHSLNTGLVVMVTDRLLPCRRGARDEGNCSTLNGSSQISSGQRLLYYVILLLAGLLWGVHPLRVESVAWVAERKDVLNGMFVLASVLAYMCYAKRRERADSCGTGRFYAAALLLFACSLLAKPSSVVLPAVLLLVDWYPLGRLSRLNAGRLLLEKLPFVILAAIVTAITIAAKVNYGGMQSMAALPFAVRLVLSGNAVFEYIRMTVWPVGIIFFYPLSKPIPTLFIFKTVAVVLVTLMLAVRARKRPWLAAPWLCFLALLLPVLAFMHNGIDIALAPRFTYLASIVASIVIAAALVNLAERSAEISRPIGLRAGAMLLVALLTCYGWTTDRLIRTWKDTGTLWTRQIDIMPLGRAFNARGHYYLLRERYPDAIQDFSTALDIAARSGQPFVDNILAFRGEAYRLAGDNVLAAADFTTAIELNPVPRYFYHRGLALRELGRRVEADNDFIRSAGDNGPIVWFTEKES